MDDLISRAYVLAEYDRQHKGPPGGARKIIEDAPAVDAVPVVHGHWIDQCGDFECSECHTLFDYEVLWYYCHSNYRIRDDDFAFCPSCGAKMDGEREDDNGADA